MASLSHLLRDPALKLKLVQAGPGDPEISWASTTELLDLSAYLEGGEVILTTGLALEADDHRWRDFVASLSRARVAGIGFGVGVNHPKIPAPLIQAASAYGVALFEVPLPVPFIAVSKAVAALLRFDELSAAREALQAQQRLLSSTRGSQEPAQILARLAEATGRHLALIGSDGTPIAQTAGYSARLTGPEAAAADPIEFIALEVEGGLSLGVAGTAPLSAAGRTLITIGALILGVELRGERGESRRERARWERLTDELVYGALPPGALAILTGHAGPLTHVRVLALRGTAEDIAAWRRLPRAGLDRLVTPARDDVRTQGLETAWQICANSAEGDGAATDGAHDGALDAELEAALDAALSVARQHRLDVAVGRIEQADALVLSRRSAAAHLTALSITAPLYTSPRTPEVVWADRASPVFEALLSAERTAAVASHVAPGTEAGSPLGASVLGALSRGSTEVSGTEREMLRDTLLAVFQHNGQRGPAADRLGIHRNTLRDRVTRIEALTQRSLGNPNDRAELWFALRLEELGTAQ